MEAIKIIKNRRSIRKYNGNPISAEDIQTILECAMSSPTARNIQGWRFVVVDKKELLTSISQGIEHGKMCKDADKAIVVCYEIDDETSKLYWQQDASAATQTILLSATALGISSVWVAVHPRQEKAEFITELFNLPKNIKPLSIVALGYNDNYLKEADRFDKNKIVYNGYKKDEK